MATNPEDLLIIFSLASMGFFGGFSHCLTMCGPFVITQVSNQLSTTKIDDYRGLKKLTKIALLPYHCGRITTYAIIGFCCSYLRTNLDNKIGFDLLSGLLILLACGYFINLFIKNNNLSPKILHPILQFSFFDKVKNYFHINKFYQSSKKYLVKKFLGDLLKILNQKITFLLKNSTGYNGYILGIILGFLPCGMLYGAFGLAGSLDNYFLAFLAMIIFGIATFFALFFVGLFAKFSFKLPEFKIIANIIIIINILMLFKMFLKKLF